MFLLMVTSLGEMRKSPDLFTTGKMGPAGLGVEEQWSKEGRIGVSALGKNIG
jgi:hypothetical protein